MHEATAPAVSSGTPFPRTPQIIFANWREALHQSGLSSGMQTVCSLAVQGYLDYCAPNAIMGTHPICHPEQQRFPRRTTASCPSAPPGRRPGMLHLSAEVWEICGTGSDRGLGQTVEKSVDHSSMNPQISNLG
jgi:hypothetical protein